MKFQPRKWAKWYAGEIAKIYLLNSGLVNLLPDREEKYDFIAVSSRQPLKQFPVKIKATKYRPSEIFKAYQKTRANLVRRKSPVLVMYVDYDSREGFYEYIDNKLPKELSRLDIKQFNRTLGKLIK